MAPLNCRHTVTYDLPGRMQSEQDAKGQRTTHVYSGRGEETSRLYADQTRLTFSYDARGSLLQIADVTGLRTQTFDALGRLQTVNGPGHPNGHPFTSLYDSVGNRIRLDTGWGGLTYTYDARNQMSGLLSPNSLGLVASDRTTWTYDPRGLMTRQDNPNATRCTYTYDANRRALQALHTKSDATEIDRAFYAYDPLGRPSFKDTLTARFTYGYDAGDQLTSEHTPAGRTTWTYDAA